MLSRGVSVQRGRTLIVNLLVAQKCNRTFAFLLPVLPHALDLITKNHT